jgi:hypothetical protein
LEANYLRDPSIGNEKLRDDLYARILSKCLEFEDFGDVDLKYDSKLEQWLIDLIQSCIFNTKRLMMDL